MKESMTQQDLSQQDLSIPVMRERIEFKPKFVERYTQLTDFESFKTASLAYIRKCIRVNTLKSSVPEIKKRLNKDWDLKPVPWCKEGLWIEYKHPDSSGRKRRDIGNLLEHALGYFYVQEAASMIPPVVLQPKKDSTVLDLCAAPGSKTTQIASMIGNTGLIVANDLDMNRLASLGLNIQRCGLTNTVVTKMYGQQFKRCNLQFDFILADVVCSGTGTIRKSLQVLEQWSPGLVQRMVKEQKSLARTAFEKLAPRGTMVYSTCTMEPEENEGVVQFLLDTFDNLKLEKITLPLKRSPTIDSFEGATYSSEIKKCLRIWPQDNDTEGFFVAKIKKVK